MTCKLVKATLRYNHVVNPPNGLTDNAVSGYGELSQIAGFDVRQKVKELLNINFDDSNWTEFMEKYFDGTNVDCSDTEITSLVGAPQEVGGNFDCSYCEKLTSLEGAPNEVSGDFDCSHTKITSLKGAPVKVDGDFYYNYTNIPQSEIEAYKRFLKHPTPDHIDETGHYKP